MLRFTIPLSLIAVAVLSACAHKAAPAPTVVVAPPAATVVQAAPVVAAPPTVVAAALRPGSGRIETLAAVPGPQASTGASQGAMRRVGIRMDDGTVQFVDTDAPSLSIGDRVELTADGYIKRPAS